MADGSEASTGPVIVLAGMRSGSTLLRFILDSHPALLCPEETNVLQWCQDTAALWRQLEGPGHRELSATATSSIRSVAESMFADRLLRAGKRRWCDRSVDSVNSAWAFAKIYPDARFVCVYRHCLDVIDSALDAYPWGLEAPSFASFVQEHPGNNVAALASYWRWSTSAILRFEKAHPELCHRIHYEDLVSTPEYCAAELLDWLGEAPAPGITVDCFSRDHGLPGRGDHKIWATSSIHRSSVGRGVKVPYGKIPDATRKPILRLLSDLGYPASASTIRARSGRPEEMVAADPLQWQSDAALSQIEAVIHTRLSASLDTLGEIPEAWQRVLHRRPIKLAVLPSDPALAKHWLVSVDPAYVVQRPIEPESGFAWTITAEAPALRDVLAGDLNLASALRHRRIRLGDIDVDSVSDAAPGGHSSSLDVQARRQIMVHLLTSGGRIDGEVDDD